MQGAIRYLGRTGRRLRPGPYVRRYPRVVLAQLWESSNPKLLQAAGPDARRVMMPGNCWVLKVRGEFSVCGACCAGQLFEVQGFTVGVGAGVGCPALPMVGAGIL